MERWRYHARIAKDNSFSSIVAATAQAMQFWLGQRHLEWKAKRCTRFDPHLPGFIYMLHFRLTHYLDKPCKFSLNSPECCMNCSSSDDYFVCNSDGLRLVTKVVKKNQSQPKSQGQKLQNHYVASHWACKRGFSLGPVQTKPHVQVFLLKPDFERQFKQRHAKNTPVDKEDLFS